MMSILTIVASRCIVNGSSSSLQITASLRKEIFKPMSSFVARSHPQLWNPSKLLQIRAFLFKGSHCTTAARQCTTLTGFYRNFLKRSILKDKLFEIRSRLSSTNKRQFEVNTNLHQDVLVYTNNMKDQYFKILSYFGIFQMGMWGYMSLFAVRHLRAAPAEIKDTRDVPWWKVLLYKEGQFKNALSALCLAVGAIVLFITLTYPRRTVRNLSILKGGKEVQITTYTWLGQTQTFKKPLEHLDCLQSRSGSGHHIPIKIKGKNFYYLIDKQGSFPNTDLFDFVIGLKRNIK